MHYKEKLLRTFQFGNYRVPLCVRSGGITPNKKVDEVAIKKITSIIIRATNVRTRTVYDVHCTCT